MDWAQGLPIIKTIDVQVYEFAIPNTSYIIKYSVQVNFPHDDKPWGVGAEFDIKF